MSQAHAALVTCAAVAADPAADVGSSQFSAVKRHCRFRMLARSGGHLKSHQEDSICKSSRTKGKSVARRRPSECV